MVAQILTQIGVPVLTEMLGRTLSQSDNKIVRDAGRGLSQLTEAFKNGQVSQEQLVEANRHLEVLAQLENETDKVALAQINESLRAEVASNDIYVRRMRPTFGYLIALTWAAQMFALAWVIIFETDKADLVIKSMESLGTIWAVGLSVMGIYVYKRSEEKKAGVQSHSVKEKVAQSNADGYRLGHKTKEAPTKYND